MIDTHVHLQFPHYAADVPEVLARAAAAGVTAAIIPGTTLADCRAAVALAERYADGPCALYAAVGIHPTGADEVTPETVCALRDLAQHPRVVAIGETGLDSYWPRIANRGWSCAAPEQQRIALEAQLALAAELCLPVILHDRDAHTAMLSVLREWCATTSHHSGTLHAYAGGTEFLEETLALGFYIGMDGPVTFGKATTLRAVARNVPLTRLLLETDGPYLTPEPYRGQRNEPAYLSHIAQRIAELRGMARADLDSATVANTCALFLKM